MIQDEVSVVGRRYWRQRHTVDGAFWEVDFLLVDRLLSIEGRDQVQGDLLEIGAYLGKSAILLGLHAGPQERVLICDPFDEEGIDGANTAENATSYAGLNRRGFEDNYARFVDRPPRIIQELSSDIRNHVADGSLRFAHIDGGHLYNVVAADIANVRPLLNEDGLVVLDDFRAIHTPGVAAAAWAAVATQGLVPFCLSEQKLYASWQPSVASRMRTALESWLVGHPEVRYGMQHVAGHEVLIVANPNIPTRRIRIRSLIPPVIAARLAKSPPLHLGE